MSQWFLHLKPVQCLFAKYWLDKIIHRMKSLITIWQKQLRGKDDNSKRQRPGRTEMAPIWGLVQYGKNQHGPSHTGAGAQPPRNLTEVLVLPVTSEWPLRVTFTLSLSFFSFKPGMLIAPTSSCRKERWRRFCGHRPWSIVNDQSMLASFLSVYGPVVKEKQFLKRCPKPTHMKSFPCWILEHFLIWDDKNNLSWQMA